MYRVRTWSCHPSGPTILGLYIKLQKRGNAAMEWEFCPLLEYVLFEYLRSLFLSTDLSKLDLIDFD